MARRGNTVTQAIAVCGRGGPHTWCTRIMIHVDRKAKWWTVRHGGAVGRGEGDHEYHASAGVRALALSARVGLGEGCQKGSVGRR